MPIVDLIDEAPLLVLIEALVQRQRGVREPLHAVDPAARKVCPRLEILDRIIAALLGAQVSPALGTKPHKLAIGLFESGPVLLLVRSQRQARAQTRKAPIGHRLGISARLLLI